MKLDENVIKCKVPQSISTVQCSIVSASSSIKLFSCLAWLFLLFASLNYKLLIYGGKILSRVWKNVACIENSCISAHINLFTKLGSYSSHRNSNEKLKNYQNCLKTTRPKWFVDLWLAQYCIRYFGIWGFMIKFCLGKFPLERDNFSSVKDVSLTFPYLSIKANHRNFYNTLKNGSSSSSIP